MQFWNEHERKPNCWTVSTLVQVQRGDIFRSFERTANLLKYTRNTNLNLPTNRVRIYTVL